MSKKYLFLVANEDIENLDDDVRLFVASNEHECMDELAKIESVNETFREYIEDKAINMSFLEKFCFLDGEYIFNPTLSLGYTDNVLAACVVVDQIEQFVDELIESNIRIFFGDEIAYADQYINYIRSDNEPTFDSDLYYFIARKLIEGNEWLSADIRKLCEVELDEGQEFTVLH